MDEKAALQAQVEALQLKLHQLHATDVNTFRRSYATITQHVEALKVEASRLEALIHDVEPDIYTPEFVAEEVGKAAVVGGAGWVLYKVVKSIPPIPAKARSWLAGGLFVATAAVISWRFASSSIGRFASAFFDHRRRKKTFLKELAELQHRIDILLAITASLPHALSQPSLAALAAPEPAASSAAASRSGSGGNGGREQFVVVDLPRVESGGFVMPSPVPSPPPAVLASGLPPVAPSAAAVGSTAAAVPAAGGAGSGGVSAGVLRPVPGLTGAAATAAGAGPFAAAAQQRGPALTAAAAVAGPVGREAASPGADAAAGGLGPGAAGVQEGAAALSGEGRGGMRQSADVQQWQEALQAAQAATSSSSGGGNAGYEIPDSVMKAGWGGVTQQQQQPWQPHLYPPVPGQQLAAGVQQQQQQQQPQPPRQASPAVRQWSSGVLGEEEGEFVEQPSDPEDQAATAAGAASTSSGRALAGQLLPGGAAAGAGAAEQKAGALQRASPASSSSEDAVLLERE